MCPSRTCLLIAATLLLTACGAASGGPTPVPTVQVTAAPSVSPSSNPLPGSNGNPDAQAAVVDGALRDAAAHLGVSMADVHVDRVEPRQWGDSSLGCPRPGLMYSQIVTPGFLIIISGAGKILEYHTDTRDRVVLCKET
jgi:hypothetical protein